MDRDFEFLSVTFHTPESHDLNKPESTLYFINLSFDISWVFFNPFVLEKDDHFEVYFI